MKVLNGRRLIWLLTAALVAGAFAACAPSEDGGPPDGWNTDEQEDRFEGQTDFVSADGRNGEQSRENTDDGNNAGAEADAAAPGDDSGRTVEEGDIYRVMADDDYVLNLNSYRGLQVIDFTDPADPSIIGRLRVTGTPVEMYQVGDLVYILMNNWRGYYGTRDDLIPQQYNGGVVVVADISDPTAPVMTGQAQVPGNIRTSRLTRGNNQEALFVVAQEYANGSQTYVKSFSVSSQGALQEASELQLGGYVGDIQATPERLMVARTDYSSNNNRQTEVTLIDITDPSGQMVEGETVTVQGIIHNQFNMHIHDDVMRLVSGGVWNGTNTNHLETFDITDIQNITAIDHATFGDTEDLFATIFFEDRAFFVTYLRVDPFHAFSIDADGFVEEKSEFIVSGWNDYFQAVEADTRLVGIGKNDENGNTMAVSLYDITDLENPNPLITREEVDLDWSWSEAQWDHRAYSVLEKGTNVTAPSGEQETGLVLLPFSGYDSDEGRYVSAVQIFTFSANTLTSRGTMDHGSRVRRSFVADDANNTTANLSEVELSLFDTTDPDAPDELGRVSLAANYTDFMIFGGHGVRRESRQRYYYGYHSDVEETDSLQIVPLSGDPDTVKEVASIDVAAGAQVYQVGDLLVTAEMSRVSDSNDGSDVYETALNIWDLSDPTSPTHRATLTTQDIEPSNSYAYYNDGYVRSDCFDCGYYYGSNIDARVVDDAIVFVSAQQQRELLGTTHYRWINGEHTGDEAQCWTSEGQNDSCVYYSGGIRCTQLERLDGTTEPEVCEGAIRRCTRDSNGQTTCTEVDPDDIQTREHDYSYEQYRRWKNYSLVPVELSNPDSPSVGTDITMPQDEDDISVLARGDSLYVTFREQTEVSGDSRPYVRYYFKEIDFTQPSSAQVGPAINIPGELIDVDGDTIITRDYLWGENIVEAAVNKLVVNNGLAYLQGTQRYRDRQVRQVALDGAGNVLVSHELAWRVANDAPTVESSDDGAAEEPDRSNYLSILDLDSANFDELADLQLDRWATLRDARAGRALFSIPGGLLVINLDQPAAPFAQAYFPTRAWPRDIIVEGDDIYFAGGLYGMYKFGLDEANLNTD